MKTPYLYPIIPIVVALLLLSMAVSAQGISQTIRGVAVDKDTHLSIIDTEDVVQNTDPLNGDVPDIDDKFRIENVVVNSDKETILNLACF